MVTYQLAVARVDMKSDSAVAEIINGEDAGKVVGLKLREWPCDWSPEEPITQPI